MYDSIANNYWKMRLGNQQKGFVVAGNLVFNDKNSVRSGKARSGLPLFARI